MSDEAAGAAAGLGTRAVSNAAFILGARVVSRVLSLFVVVYLANGLGDVGYGRYSTLIAYLALVSVIVAIIGGAPATLAAGLVYFTLGPVRALHGMMSGQRRRRLERSTATV